MDIVCILVLTLITIPVVEFTTGVPRIILGVIVLLVFPGYSLLAALFPGKRSLRGIERAGFMFVLSFAIVALSGLLLNYTPWGIRLHPIVISITLIIFLTGGIALYRRSRLPAEQRFRLEIKVRLPDWKGTPKIDRVLYIALAIAVIGALSTLGYVIARPKTQENFSNFYILGPQGKMENYPSSVVLGESVQVEIGIDNHENRATAYSIAVTLAEHKMREIGPIELAPEESWTEQVSITPAQAGENQRIEYLLFKNGESQPYLQLHLWVDVTGRK